MFDAVDFPIPKARDLWKEIRHCANYTIFVLLMLELIEQYYYYQLPSTGDKNCAEIFAEWHNFPEKTRELLDRDTISARPSFEIDNSQVFFINGEIKDTNPDKLRALSEWMVDVETGEVQKKKKRDDLLQGIYDCSDYTNHKKFSETMSSAKLSAVVSGLGFSLFKAVRKEAKNSDVLRKVRRFFWFNPVYDTQNNSGNPETRCLIKLANTKKPVYLSISYYDQKQETWICNLLGYDFNRLKEWITKNEMEPTLNLNLRTDKEKLPFLEYIGFNYQQAKGKFRQEAKIIDHVVGPENQDVPRIKK